MAGLIERLEQCYSGAVYDALRELGHPARVLPPEIRPLDPTRKLAGRVFTVSGRYDLALDPHQTLLAWTGLLSKAPADSVVVCQPNDTTLAHMGELSAAALRRRGVRGYVVDGGTRDADFLIDIGFPVYCRYLTPADIVGRWVVEALGEPIEIAGVPIQSSDYLLGDRDGVVLIPGDAVEAVVIRTEELAHTETDMRRAILDGMDPQEAYLQYGMS